MTVLRVLEMAPMTVQACLLLTRDGRQTNDSAESAGNGTNDSPGMPAVWNNPQGDHNDGSQTSEVAECIICCSSIVELECQVLLT
jgi:hypothetical protein